MADDVRKQLVEALDQAEKLAKRAASLCGCHPPAPEWAFDPGDEEGRILVVDDPHPEARRKLSRRWNGTYEGLFMAEHIARWDPSTVLRLIERDRALLAEFDKEMVWLDEETDPTVRVVVGGLLTAREGEIKRAAAFWLGTPEAGS
jgi:hypothetical protein